MNGEVTYVGEVLGVFTCIGHRMNKPQFVRLLRPMAPDSIKYYYHTDWIAEKLVLIGDDWS